MAVKASVTQLEPFLARCAAQTEADLRRWLAPPGAPKALTAGMRYCVSGGKRLRPALVRLCAEAARRNGRLSQARRDLVRRAAVAVELVHVYSLVHDDLPAMDDDALRRGRATAHVKFGEAMAILIGDALLTRAFGVLAESGSPTASLLSAELSTAAGAAGMIAGQVADMGLCPVPKGAAGLRYIHLRKTAAMLRAAARMGAIAAGADARTLARFSRFAEALGLAFQLFDDLLDSTATAEHLGKTPGKDARTGKRTHLAEIGRKPAEQLGRRLTAHACRAVEPLGRRSAKLQLLAEMLSRRTR